jgi:transcriptional regulator
MIEFKYFLHGGLPDGLTLENIKQGMVAKRNKITVEILDKLDAIENYASGVRRIFKDYIGFDKQPEYSISDNGIIVTLYNMNYNEAQNEVINDGINEDINDVINVGQKLNTEERKNIILKLIEENEKISIQQIVENIEVSKSTVERDLKELKEENKIKYIGSRKSGKWIINYEQENVGINEEINVGIKRENVGINDSEKMNTELRHNSILNIIKENGNISAIEISKILNVTARTIERDLKELKEENKIEYVGSRKSGKWIIKE